jgi:hypothetical protein
MLIDTIGNQLKYIKIGIVITTILSIDSYPLYNPANFVYSGIYMPYTSYNLAQSITQSSRSTLGGQNYNFFGPLDQVNRIYGITSFYVLKLPA